MKFGRHRARESCPHHENVVVRASSVERRVCEACGHVSIQFLEGLSGKADRGQFERSIDRRTA